MKNYKGIVKLQTWDRSGQGAEFHFFTQDLKDKESEVVQQICTELKLGMKNNVEIIQTETKSAYGANIKIKFYSKEGKKGVFPKYLHASIFSVAKTVLLGFGYRFFSSKYNIKSWRSTYYFQQIDNIIAIPLGTKSKFCYFLARELKNNGFWLIIKENEKIVQELIDHIKSGLTENGSSCEAEIENKHIDRDYLPREIYFKVSSYGKKDSLQEYYISLIYSVLSKYGYWISKQKIIAESTQVRVMINLSRMAILTEMPPLLASPLSIDGRVNFAVSGNLVIVSYFLSTPERTKEMQLKVFDTLSKLLLAKKHNLRVKVLESNVISHGTTLIYTTTKSSKEEMFVDCNGALIQCFQGLKFIFLDTEDQIGYTFGDVQENKKLLLLKHPTGPFKLVFFRGFSDKSQFRILSFGFDCKSRFARKFSKSGTNLKLEDKMLARDFQQLKVKVIKWWKVSSLSFQLLALKTLQNILIPEGLYMVGDILENKRFRFTFQPLGSVQISNVKFPEPTKIINGLCLVKKLQEGPISFVIRFCLDTVEDVHLLVDDIANEFNSLLEKGHRMEKIYFNRVTSPNALVKFKIVKRPGAKGNLKVSARGELSLVQEVFAKYGLLLNTFGSIDFESHYLFSSRSLVASKVI